MTRSKIALTTLALLALTGCNAAPPSPGGPQGTFDETTGALEGLVVDDSLLPLSDVAVTLDRSHATAVSDASGRFAFSFLSPGSYVVSAGRDGYATATQGVAVESGHVAQVQVQLTALAANVSYPEVRTASGFIGCSAAVWQPTSVVANNQPIGLCVLVEDGFRTSWEVPTLADVSGFWIETTWEPTQVAGNGFSTFWPFYRDGSSLGYLGRFEGTAPLSDPVPPDALEAYLAEEGLDATACDGAPCRLEGWHYTYPNALNNAYPVDAGVQFQQAYEDYVTVFHGPDFPSAYSALPDE